MTYARARLWLGISGVGLAVTTAVLLLLTRMPQRLFPTTEVWSAADPLALVALIAAFTVFMLPFDVLGGYLLPLRFNRPAPRAARFARQWLMGVGLQGALFLATGLVILAAGRAAGTPGAVAVVGLTCLFYLAAQPVLVRLLTGKWRREESAKLASVLDRLGTRRLGRLRTVVVDHSDPGFTGGIVGLPGRETIMIPRRWIDGLSEEQLAVAVARRIEAIRSGSRSWGAALAILWVVLGFTLACWLPGGGARSVAELVTTCCGFTFWAFLGLLTLPTISRQASYHMDRRVMRQGIDAELLDATLSALDQWQDDEPARPALVETIFHPVPSVSNRRRAASEPRLSAWHAARMALFLSWSCLGFLSRAVHCNAGRPELWAMLPTD